MAPSLTERGPFSRRSAASSGRCERFRSCSGVFLLIAVVLGLIGSIGAVVDDGGGGSEDVPGRGVNVHGRLTPGVTLETTTEAGTKVRATITEFTWRQGPVFTARISGGEPRSLEADAWTFRLDGDLKLALSREQVGDQTYRFWLEGSLPAGSKVRFIAFDPGDGDGDIYFDVE